MRKKAKAGIFAKNISQLDRLLASRQSLAITGFVEWIFIFVASFRARKGHLRGGRAEEYETHSLHQHFNRWKRRGPRKFLALSTRHARELLNKYGHGGSRSSLDSALRREVR